MSLMGFAEMHGIGIYGRNVALPADHGLLWILGIGNA
jgi:hypothetical protein